MRLIFAEERCLWPQEASQRLKARQFNSVLEKAVLLSRVQEWQRMEAALLQPTEASTEAGSLQAELLCGLQLRQGKLHEVGQLLDHWSTIEFGDTQGGWFLRRCQWLLLQGRASEVMECWPADPALHPLLSWMKVQALAELGNAQEAIRLGQDLLQGCLFPEAIEIQARLLASMGFTQPALALLEQLLARSAGQATSWALVVHLLAAKPQDQSVHLTRSLQRFPRQTNLLGRQAVADLDQRRPSQARRHSLLERLQMRAVSPADLDRSDSNLLLAYEQSGRSDLTLPLHASLHHRRPNGRSGLANQALQLASLQQSERYAATVAALAKLLPAPEPLYQPPRTATKPLRVGLVSPDLDYHPVGRFLYMWMQAGLEQGGELHLIHTSQENDRLTRLFRELAEARDVPMHAIAGQSETHQLALLRELQLDVAIDLAGWSSENAGHLFAPRVAPTQVNYLGFFASSGLAAMDVWLGDQHLFPDPMLEWHSERIVRLPRCFLAWQPSPDLPEGQVSVPSGPQRRQPIRFGCFNHARKLSASTLRLWGRLLQAIPDSRLLLKSFSTDDPGVVALLCRRMRQCGLDPERVDWLPSCPDAADHLRQYGLLDVALDPFPNGGCTTTCEALWMGVPVITLRGDHYVSRMATAVLDGAQLPEWIATSEEQYLQLALQAADQLHHIRANREQLRRHLQSSPLGDAAGLNKALWATLGKLQPLPQ